VFGSLGRLPKTTKVFFARWGKKNSLGTNKIGPWDRTSLNRPDEDGKVMPNLAPICSQGFFLPISAKKTLVGFWKAPGTKHIPGWDKFSNDSSRRNGKRVLGSRPDQGRCPPSVFSPFQSSEAPPLKPRVFNKSLCAADKSFSMIASLNKLYLNLVSSRHQSSFRVYVGAPWSKKREKMNAKEEVLWKVVRVLSDMYS